MCRLYQQMKEKYCIPVQPWTNRDNAQVDNDLTVYHTTLVIFDTDVKTADKNLSIRSFLSKNYSPDICPIRTIIQTCLSELSLNSAISISTVHMRFAMDLSHVGVHVVTSLLYFALVTSVTNVGR